MYAMNKFIAVVIAIAPLSAIASSSGDPCQNAGSISLENRVTLQSAALNKHGFFVGTFRVDNLSKDNALMFRGTLDGSNGIIKLAEPDTSIEYQDISSQWQSMLEIPGSFYSPKEERIVPPGKSLLFTAELFSADRASLSAGEFRLLIRTRKPPLCLISVPFYGLPPRPTVNQLKSVE
jgi:hypothetical protein